VSAIRAQFRQPGSRSLVYNRLAAVLEHVQAYYFEGPSKLAADAGVSRSALSRLVHGKSSPSYVVVCKVAAAIEKHLGHPIDPRDLVSIDGQHPTKSVCDLCAVQVVSPPVPSIRTAICCPAYRHLHPGKWTLKASRHGKQLESTTDARKERSDPHR